MPKWPKLIKTMSQSTASVCFLCITTYVNNKHAKPSFKRKRRVKFKDRIYAELRLSLCFDVGWYFCNIADSGRIGKRLSRNKVLNSHFLKSQMFFKIGVPRNILIFTGKIYVGVSF